MRSSPSRPRGAAVRLRFIAPLAMAALVAGCAVQRDDPNVAGQDLRISFLHTADIHSRLLPYRMSVMLTDKNLGLLQENEPFGGIARMASIIHRERQRGDRVLLLDSGDCFQGAPIFNVFKGEEAIKTMSLLRPDAVVVGNHEFDEGLGNYIDKLERFSTFPTVAANYLFTPGNKLGSLVEPYVIVNANGLKVGVIGVANFSSMSSITDIGNSLGIIPLNIEQVVQEYIEILRPQVDLIVAVSHAGLSKDERLIRCTSGLDAIFGGHLHIVLQPPRVIQDASGRDVLLAHSGAFAKYVGRLDTVVRQSEDPREGWEIVQHKYELFPVDATVPHDAKMLETLEPYQLKLNQTIDLTSIFAYTPRILTKYGYAGGDSSLGNLVAETIRQYARVDIGFTNTLGIRANMYPGVITQDDLYNIFPFENTLTLMFMSGTDLRDLMDYVTGRSAGRGCVSQLQISGIEFTMNCNFAPPACRCDTRGPVCPGNIELSYEGVRGYDCYGRNDSTDRRLGDECRDICECPDDAEWVSDCRCPPYAEDIVITSCPDPSQIDRTGCEKRPLDMSTIYQVATNDYIAHGGSGFVILRNNNTQLDTRLPLREAVLERIIRSPKCVEECRMEDGSTSFSKCATLQGCVRDATAYHDQFCRHLRDTTVGEVDVPTHCAVDDQACEEDADCFHFDLVCATGDCKTCQFDANCDAAAGERCYAGFCRTPDARCLDGRCRAACTDDTDCPGWEDVPTAQGLCLQGVCLPATDGLCFDVHDCAPGGRHCFGDSPGCTTDEDCAAGTVCRGRLCIPEPVDCAGDGDCLAAGLGVSTRCLEGRCILAAVACELDGDCAESGGVCLDGICSSACQACARDEGCPPGLICGDGFCVAPLATCEENRCRALCDADEDCLPGSTCEAGRCLPLLCTQPQDLETVCEVENVWKAQEECKELPCPISYADGRIGRILPENLENLPDVYEFDDPEDIDENLFGEQE